MIRVTNIEQVGEDHEYRYEVTYQNHKTKYTGSFRLHTNSDRVYIVAALRRAHDNYYPLVKAVIEMAQDVSL